MTRLPATVLCLLGITIYVSACGGDRLNDVEKSVADEAIHCSGLFHLLTAIPGNLAAAQAAMLMGEVYREHTSELMGKGISDGDLLTARNKTVEMLRSEYDDNPDGVIDLMLRCNSWRASIVATFQEAVRESTDGTLSASDIEQFMLSLTAPIETPSVPPGDKWYVGKVIEQAIESDGPDNLRGLDVNDEEVLEVLRNLAEASK